MNFYTILKEAHSGWRWIVLVLAIAVVIDFAMGMISRRSFKPLDNCLSLFYMISADIQLLLGLILYFFLSPITQSFMQGNSTMADEVTRFYSVEHPAMMILAIAFAHVGRTLSKKAVIDRKKFQRGVICFGISLALLLAGIRW